MTTEDTRPGSGADLSRRMDHLEKNHEALAATVSNLASTVVRVEQNQTHQSELNKLRFDSLDTSINGVTATLERFMARINSLITGEVQLPQSTALMADWKNWRGEVDDELESQAVRNGRLDLIGRILVLLVTSQILAIAAAAYALIRS